MLLENVFVILHNVHAVSKVLDMAQTVYGLGFPNFVITKPEGSAAQSGIPDANKLALKFGGNFMVLPDLPDAIQLLNIETVILLVSPLLTKNRLDFDSLYNEVTVGKRIAVVVTGSTSSFSKKEMTLGHCISLNSHVDIGPVSTASIVLYALKSHISNSGDITKVDGGPDEI